MANPATREEFKQKCLRKLGAPVIEINVDEDQVQDRIDDALAYYRDYHYDGTEKAYFKHQITANNITNGYVDIPESITTVVGIFPIGTGLQTNNIFNLRYQIALNEVFDWASSQLQNYTMAMERIALLEQILVGQQPVRFNRHTDKLYIDMDWSRVTAGQYIIIECYRWLDPDVYTDVWSDWWLSRYATALIKKQWGTNMKKFEGMTLPGGLTFNGQKIFDEAEKEIEKLESEMIMNFSLPVHDMLG